jgi:hypothetical protein
MGGPIFGRTIKPHQDAMRRFYEPGLWSAE